MKPKRFKVDEDEYKEIIRLREIKKEDKQRQRKITVETNIRRIKHFERLIEHKQEQVDSGETLEKHENYTDGMKPIFMLTNEIEEIQANIEQLKEVNATTQKEYDDNPN